jgi:hypothetical protein
MATTSGGGNIASLRQTLGRFSNSIGENNNERRD